MKELENENKMLRINNIFYSLQGEGKEIGIPTCFIRTSGCNLRCSWCDTKYALKLEDGKVMTFSQIFNTIGKYPMHHICITGGEPLMQPKIFLLLKKLLEEGYKVNLETNGSFSVERLLQLNDLLISLDIKCPSSQMHKRMELDNIKLLRKHDQLKFVLKDLRDYNYARKLLVKYKPKAEIIFMPCWEANNVKLLVKNLLNENAFSFASNIRFLLQFHKVLNIS